MRATDQLPEPPRWSGINHLALVTPDMDATVRFYAGTLGMRVVATTMADRCATTSSRWHPATPSRSSR